MTRALRNSNNARSHRRQTVEIDAADAGWARRIHAPASVDAFSTQCIVLFVAIALTSPAVAQVAAPPALTTVVVPPALPAGMALAPAPGQKDVHKVTMTVDARWVEGNGYQPVSVRLVPTRPTTADREFSIAINVWHNNWQYWETEKDTVFEDLILPAGSKGVETTISVPRRHDTTFMTVDLFEDDQQLAELSGVNVNFAGTGFGMGFGLSYGIDVPSILFIHQPGLPDLSGLVQAWGVAPSVSQLQVAATKGDPYGEFFARWINRPPTDLPDRWIDYTSLDLICLPVDELDSLAVKYPSRWDAIRRWVAAGGNLVVTEIDNGKSLQLLHQHLELPPLSDHQLSEDMFAVGWHRPHPGTATEQIQGLTESHAVAINQRLGVQQTYDVNGNIVPFLKPDPAASQPFEQRSRGLAWREYQMGLVVAVAGDPFPGSADRWRMMFNVIGEDRWSWTNRQGVTYMAANGDYWNFLIPGVGLPPVTGFQVLITLFVIAIGPLNFFLARRWKRRQMLIITIPAAAGLITAMLFAYAFLADGLGVRTRVRSVSHLDQTRGHVVTHARLSYYAGIAPSQGLAVSQDTAVYPFPAESRNDYYGRRRSEEEPPRTIYWDGEDQNLTSGWLRSRMPVQYLTVRSRPTARALQVKESAGKAPAVNNRLGATIERLLLSNSAGRLFAAENLAAGESTRLAAAGDEDREAWQEQFRLNTPHFPPRFGRQRRSGIFESNYYYGYDEQPQSLQRRSRMEQMLKVIWQATGTADINLPPGSYAALVKTSPEVELGTASATEEASFHLILGEW